MNDSLIKGKKVLVADDNAINQMVVNHTLQNLGAKADIVNNGDEAIAKFKSENYDLVLMDIQMPALDGYEATNYLRNNLGSNVPIIAMTAFAINGENEKCIDRGMNGYIAKPFTGKELSNVIEKVLSVPGEAIVNPHIIVKENVSVDLSLLYDISGDDENYICLMLETFLENMPKTMQKMEQNLLDKDWEALYSSAHYAKSSLSVIKVNDMFEAVLRIEGNAKKTVNLTEIPFLMQKVKDTFLIVKDIISKKIKATQSGLPTK